MSENDLFDFRYGFGNNDYHGAGDTSQLSDEQHEIEELKYNNNKLTDIIKDLKIQLTAAEESNASLQSEFEYICSKLKIEQSISNDLQRKLIEYNDFKETEINLQQKSSKLECKLKEIEKETTQLLKIIDLKENEKNQIEESFEKIKVQLTHSLKANQIYQENIDTLNNKLAEKELIITEMSIPKLEFEQTIIDQKSKIEYLLFENEILKKNQKIKLHCSPLLEHLKTSIHRESSSCVNEHPLKLPDNEHGNINHNFNTFSGSALIPFKKKNRQYSLSDCMFIKKESTSKNKSDINIGFKPAVETEHFKFYNYDSPIVKSLKKNTKIEKYNLNNSSFQMLVNNPVSPICDSPDISKFNKKISKNKLSKSYDSFFYKNHNGSNSNLSSSESIYFSASNLNKSFDSTTNYKSFKKGSLKTFNISDSLFLHKPILDITDTSPNPTLTLSSEEEYALLTECDQVPFHKSLKSELKEFTDYLDSEDDVVYKNKIKFLENQIEHLESDIKIKNACIESLEAIVNDVENSLDIEKCKSDKLMLELNNIKIEKEHLENAVGEMKIEIRKISDSYRNLTDKYIKEIEILKEKIKSLKELNEYCNKYESKFQTLKKFLFDKSQKINSALDTIFYKLHNSKKHIIDLSTLNLDENINLFPDEDINLCAVQVLKCLHLLQILGKLDELIEVEYKDASLQVDLKSKKSDTTTQTEEIKNKFILKPAVFIYNSNKSKATKSKFSVGTNIQYKRMVDLEMETLSETIPLQINSKSMNNSTNSSTELNNNIEDSNSNNHLTKTSAGWTEDGQITEYKYTEELCSLARTQLDSQNEINTARITVSASVEPEFVGSASDASSHLLSDNNKNESVNNETYLLVNAIVNKNHNEREMSLVVENSKNFEIDDLSSSSLKTRIPAPRLEDIPIRQESNRSISASSTNSGSSESLSIDNEFCVLRDEIKHNVHSSLEETVENTKHSSEEQNSNELAVIEDSLDEKKLNDRSRSQSISDASTDSKNEEIDIFPTLSDSTLEELGLLRNDVFENDCSPELDEIEKKYQALTLAFVTDTMTLHMRHNRLRRLRDQAEDNLTTEIARLDNGIRRLKLLCVDAERTELVSSLLAQIDVLIQASTRAYTSSETYGAVKQEWRLCDAINLIINYVDSLKQQRDTARRQLQCTKRMLQDSTTVEGVKAINIRQKASSPSHSINANNRLIARRRASIAAISRPLGTIEPNRPFTRNQLPPTSLNLECLPRRSKLPERLSPSRSSLSPRSEHNGEILQHITEYTENTEGISEHESRRESCESHSTEILLTENTSMRRISLKVCNLFRRFVGDDFLRQGTFSEICCTGALLCFTVALMLLANTMLEYFMMKNSQIIRGIPWGWCSWEEIFSPFIEKKYINGSPPI